MITRKTWKEFRDSKLLWWVNRSLHIFGWSICLVVNEQNGDIVDAYPARVKYRGFDEANETEGFIVLSEYLKQNIDELGKEAKE